MATQIRKTDQWVQPVADLVNALKAQIGAGSNFHLDKSEVKPSTANLSPVGLAPCLVALNELIGVYTFHAADLLAHKVADAGSLPAIGAAVDLASAQTAANLLKTFHTAHIASTTVNYAADATNTIGAANATNQASLETLIAALQTAITAHMASGPSAPSVRAMPA